MNCRKVQEQLQALLDGELDAGRSARVREHLCGCLRCQMELAEAQAFDNYLHRLDDDVGTAPGLSVSPTFVARVVALAQSEAPPVTTQPERVSRWTWLRSLRMPVPLVTAAVFLLAVLSGYYMGRRAMPLVMQTPRPARTAPSHWLELVPSELAALAPTVQTYEQKKEGRP